MKLARQLARWKDAGLIDAQAAEKIAAFEARAERPFVWYALGVLGAGTLALGVISVVASNWQAIPAGVKLALDVMLLSGLACATYVAQARGRTFATEVLVMLLYGGALASLGLIGQIYQTGTPLYQALLVWSFSTAPMMLLGRTRLLANVWLLGLASTHGMAFEALFDALSQRWDAATFRNIAAVLCFVSPLMYAGLARAPWLLRERAELSRAFTEAAWLAIAGAGLMVQFLWYTSLTSSETLSWGLLVNLGFAVASAWSIPARYADWPKAAQHAASGLLIACALSLALATGFARGALSYVGALVQVGVLALVAYGLYALGLRKAFQTCTALIGLRLLVVYFEAFGSLLDTGMALMSGGLLTLFLAHVWRTRVLALGKGEEDARRHG